MSTIGKGIISDICGCGILANRRVNLLKKVPRGIFFIHSLILKTGNHDHTEIRDIWRPGAGLARMRDIVAQIRDILDNPGWMATLCVIVFGVHVALLIVLL